MPVRVRRLLGTLVPAALPSALLALLLGVAGPGQVPGGGAAAAERTRAGHAELRVATYNIRADRGIRTFKRAVKAVLPHADLVGLQEVNGYKEQVLAGQDGWDYYRDAEVDYGSGECPVLWRTDRFTFHSGRVALLAPGRSVGHERPGRDSWVNNRYATVVRLLDRSTGQRISVVNVHLPPGATRAGRARPGRPRLHAMFAESVRTLAALVRDEQSFGRVFVTGDLNIGWRPDSRVREPDHPYAALRRAGLGAAWEVQRPAEGRGTRGRGLIDQIYAAEAARSARVLFEVSYSDHHPAVAVYELPVAVPSL